MVSRLALLRQVFRSRASKIITGALAFMAAYQFACDQFGAPTLPNLWGMTGAAALPWWAWLLLSQLGFLYGLFEYVRRTPLTAPADEEPAKQVAARHEGRELSATLQLALRDARAARVDARNERSAELAWPNVRAAMLTAHKTKGIPLPPETGHASIDLETACRIFERIAPLLAQGHDEEAQAAAADLIERFDRARQASA